MRCFASSALLAGGLLLSANPSNAQVLGKIWQNLGEASGSPPVHATIANAPSTAPDAEFFTTAIDYNSNVGGYSPAGFLNNPTFFNTSGTWNPNASLDDVYILFTGQTFLHAGANTFVTPHDDGFELSIPGAGFLKSEPGPTSPVNTGYTVIAPADGLYDFTLAYGECCGPPAVLGFDVNGAPVGNVPDGGATLVLLGVAGFGLFVLRKR